MYPAAGARLPWPLPSSPSSDETVRRTSASPCKNRQANARTAGGRAPLAASRTNRRATKIPPSRPQTLVSAGCGRLLGERGRATPAYQRSADPQTHCRQVLRRGRGGARTLEARLSAYPDAQVGSTTRSCRRRPATSPWPAHESCRRLGCPVRSLGGGALTRSRTWSLSCFSAPG